MRKQDIMNADDNALLVEYIRSYGEHATNYVLNRGTKRLQAHLADLERELVRRGILNERDIETLNR